VSASRYLVRARAVGAAPVTIAAVLLLLAVVGTGSTAAGASTLPAVAVVRQTAPTVTSGVDYSGTGDGSLLVDIYQPAGAATSQPAVVLVHGGGWTTGDRTQVGPDAQALAEQGIVAFSIDYRLTGPGLFPGQMDDVRTAVRWVQANAATHRVDPTRVGLFGSSAGGNLAMLVATEGLGDPSSPPVKAVVSWSGPADLTTLAPTGIDAAALEGPGIGSVPGAETPSGCTGDPACIGVIDPQAIQTYLGCTVDDCPQTYMDASPSFQVTSSSPPMLLVSAETDLVPVEQSFEMVNQLSGAGVANEILVVAGEGHAESYRSTALDPSIAFFARFLTDGTDPRTATGTPPSTVAGSQPLPALVDSYRLPTPAPPESVQAVLTPATGRTAVLVVVAVVLVAVAAIALVLWRRRRR